MRDYLGIAVLLISIALFFVIMFNALDSVSDSVVKRDHTKQKNEYQNCFYLCGGKIQKYDFTGCHCGNP